MVKGKVVQWSTVPQRPFSSIDIAEGDGLKMERVGGIGGIESEQSEYR